MSLAALAYAWVEQRLASPAHVTPLPRRQVTSLTQRCVLATVLLVLFMVSGAPLLAIVLRALLALANTNSMALLLNEETLSA